jgi:hypothetical protein
VISGGVPIRAHTTSDDHNMAAPTLLNPGCVNHAACGFALADDYPAFPIFVSEREAASGI